MLVSAGIAAMDKNSKCVYCVSNNVSRAGSIRWTWFDSAAGMLSGTSSSRRQRCVMGQPLLGHRINK